MTDRTDLILEGLRFAFIQTINPDRDPTGAIIEFRPQERYLKRATSRLHAYGDTAFCRFRIDVPHGLSGIYAFVIDSEVQYIGRCEDFRRRFNMGYGNISPKNCYVGGQPTNCRINQLVLDAVRRGRTVDLFFHQTPEYSAVEARLIARYAPPWNGGRRARTVAARTTLLETFARFGDAFKDVPDEELEREIANAQAEVRAEMRAERVARGEG